LTGIALAAIVSAGLSRFGKLEGFYAREIFAQAVKEALERCPNLDPKRDIRSLFVGHMMESTEHQGHTGPLVADWIGLNPAPAVRLESACASSGLALRSGIQAIMAGLADVVLVGGVEKQTHLATDDATEYLALSADNFFEQWHGFTFPALFALMARAHMHEYKTREEHLAMVAVKNHRNGAKNPKAHIQREVTLEQAMTSRMVASPLRLYDCSLISDGASCLILTEPRLAKRYTDNPVYIIGTGQASDTIGLYERSDFTSLRATVLAAREAYGMAGINAKDVDVAEVHDCFTIAEIMHYEDLGFCGKGEGGTLVESGATEIGGSIPVNTSGGLKAKGHPVGATGTAQAYEIYLQLTGQAGGRQVQGAEVGLTHNLGGHGSTAVVHVYKSSG
jgi:acetyl-CoA C-acetyltransferase